MAYRRRIWLHPIMLVVLAVVVGVVLNFGIWWAVYGAPPTAGAQFFVPDRGCLDRRTLPVLSVDLQPMRTWVSNYRCEARLELRVLRAILRDPTCGLKPLARFDPNRAEGWNDLLGPREAPTYDRCAGL